MASSILNASVTNASCFGKNDGIIQLVVSPDQSIDYTIIVKDSLNYKLAEFTKVDPLPLLATGLMAGKYSIEFSSIDSTFIQTVTIKSPSAVKLETINIKNVNGSLTTLEALPEGGVPPYSATWSENTGNQNTLIAENLSLGIYTCTIQDANKCGNATATFYLFEDEIEKFKSKK